jgi:hypothetical protein
VQVEIRGATGLVFFLPPALGISTAATGHQEGGQKRDYGKHEQASHAAEDNN